MCAVHVWGLRRALKTKIVVKLYMSLPRRTQWAVVQLLSPLFIWIRQKQLRELHTDTLFTRCPSSDVAAQCSAVLNSLFLESGQSIVSRHNIVLFIVQQGGA